VWACLEASAETRAVGPLSSPSFARRRGRRQVADLDQRDQCGQPGPNRAYLGIYGRSITCQPAAIDRNSTEKSSLTTPQRAVTAQVIQLPGMLEGEVVGGIVTESKPNWQPADYILHGTHCPKAIIVATLERMAANLGTARLLHVAFDRDELIGSLTFAVGFPTGLEDKVRRQLLMARRPIAARNLTAVCTTLPEVTGGQATELAELLVKEIVDTVGALRSAREPLSPEELTVLGGLKRGIYLPNSIRDSTSSPGDIRSLLLFDLVPINPAFIGSAVVTDFAVQVRSTPEASSQRDRAVMAEVEQKLVAPTTVNNGDLQTVIDNAIKLAVEVTGSDAGVVYIREPHKGDSLLRLSSYGGWSYPGRVPRGRLSPLFGVLGQNQSMQLHNWNITRQRSNQPSVPNGTVLISPVGGPAGDPWGRPVAVLVLLRHDEDAAYSAYDLALVRNVSLRIALARTTSAMSNIGVVITRLRSRVDWTEDLDVAGDVGRDANARVALPRDVTRAVGRIAPELRELAAYTDSHSATLRIALPHALVREAHGLALVRVASSGKEPWAEAQQVQEERDGGFNWECFRSGKDVYVPNVQGADGFIQVRPDTAAELSSPIRVEGQLVGTLNLESPIKGAYSNLRPLVGAFCGAVGRTLADARASLEQDVVDGAAKALNHRHTLDGKLETLKHNLKAYTIDGQLLSLLEDSLARIRTEVDEMRKVDSVLPSSKQRLPEILESAADDASYDGDLPLVPDREENIPCWDGSTARWLRICVANILSNIVNYTALSPNDSGGRPLRSIEYGLTRLGGVDSVVLTFTNYSEDPVNPAQIVNLYRCPLPDEDGKLRVGAFVAGLHARRARAWLHSLAMPDGHTVVTRLVIPRDRRGSA
jgi:GAF domain-containing protein